MAFYEFPGSNFHDLNLDWLLQEMKNCLAEWAATKADWQALTESNEAFKAAIEAEWTEVKDYITNYFANLDITEEINNKIDALVDDGTFLDLIVNSGEIASSVSSWLSANVDPDTGYVIDKTLQIANAAADAQVVGKYVDALYRIGSDIGGNVVYHDQLTPYNGAMIGDHRWLVQQGTRITIYRTYEASNAAITLAISGTTTPSPSYPLSGCDLPLIDGHTYIAYRRYISGSATNGVIARIRRTSDGAHVGREITLTGSATNDQYGSQVYLYTHDQAANGNVYLALQLHRTSTGNTLENYVTDVSVIDVTDQIAFLNKSGLLTPERNTWQGIVYEEGTHEITIPYTGDDRNMIFSVRAAYTQDNDTTAIPKFSIYCGTGLNYTGSFIAGTANTLCTREYRMVRWPGDSTSVRVVFTVPQDVTLVIDRLSFRYDDQVSRVTTGIRINAHRKLYMTPPDTEPGAIMAARAGCPAMIQIPKRLSDGTWIFYHDDSLVYNDTYIRQADGTQLPASYDHTPWDSISSEEAFSWDWGVSTSNDFAGTKPMTMQQFFLICANTGMMPMLSIHPFPTSSELEEIKLIATKLGVLSNLGLKATTANIATLYSVFGEDVESYTIDVTAGAQTEATVLAACTAMNALNIQKPRKVIELFKSTVWNAYFGSGTNYDAFNDIIAAGLECSVANQVGRYNPVPDPNNQVYIGEEHFWWYYEHGCHEFTYEMNFSNGLNW